MPRTLHGQLKSTLRGEQPSLHVVNVAEATGFCLFGVMKPTGPVDCNICRSRIELLRGGYRRVSSQISSLLESLSWTDLYCRLPILSKTRRHLRMAGNHLPSGLDTWISHRRSQQLGR